jgi:hypothetical protein
MPAVKGNTVHLRRTRLPNGQFGNENNPIKKHHCAICGAEKSINGTICKKCSGKRREDPNKKEELVCKHCGKTFLAYKSEPYRKYCSMRCFLDNHPKRPSRHNGKHVHCEYCGKEVYRRPGELKKNKTGVWFCDQTCFHTWWVGERHPNFNPNKQDPRDETALYWWKKYVLARDEACQWCGSNKNPHIHHIIPWRYNENTRFDVDNGIVLCRKHHASVKNHELEFANLFAILVRLKEISKW